MARLACWSQLFLGRGLFLRCGLVLPYGLVALMCLLGAVPLEAGEPLRVGIFDLDASPRVGSPLAYDPCDGIEKPLRLRGLVLVVEPKPIVIAAVDWIGVANEAHTFFRQALADAVGTDRSRVVLHALHQHDAPQADLTTAAMLAEHGIEAEVFDTPWFRDLVARAAEAAGKAKQEAQPVDAVGIGTAEVEQVASNRRILGPDGKVLYTRWTATKDETVRSMPVGTIDPLVKLIGFWQAGKPLVATTYYATHPQSFYRTRLANPDFPGLARDARQDATGVTHVHFNGAGGNITAGKWNDGDPANRQVLADRVADGMRRAMEAVRIESIDSDDVTWRSVQVALPASTQLDEAALAQTLASSTAPTATRAQAAAHLAWLRRCRAGDKLEVACLGVGQARILFLPGELFVEYQLEAQRLRPDLTVAVAAYGDYGTGYIGTAIAYEQGGYETSATASRVAPESEAVMVSAIRQLLEVPESAPASPPLGVEALED